MISSPEPLFRTDRLEVHRLATPDAPRLQAVYEAASDYFRVLAEGGEVGPETALGELRQCAAHPGRTAAVVSLAGGPDVGALGWWAGHPAPEVALLGMLVVLPEHRGGGVAREALRGLEGWLAGQGISQLRTAIPYRRAAAVRAPLEALGFTPMSIAEHTRMGMAGAGISLWQKALR
jgi:GNAT superfamily N-acetyltransferase